MMQNKQPTSISDKLGHLPHQPGCYLMKDSGDKIIYVGKAKDLKSRVSSYFQNGKNHSIKTCALVNKIAWFDVMIVDSEVSALILERTLIKHHSPIYNILLRDDKEYPYVRIDFNSDWPRIRMVRRRKDDGAFYLGPFGNAGYLKTMLQMAGRIFPTIKCSPYEFKNARRPCNYFHMGQCLAPCMNTRNRKNDRPRPPLKGNKNPAVSKTSETSETQKDLDLTILPLSDDTASNLVSRETYVASVRDAMAFLQGRRRDLIQQLTDKMKKSADQQHYEAAGRYRDQLAAFRGATQRQSAVMKSVYDADVIGFSQIDSTASIHVLQVRENYMSGQDNFIVQTPIQTPEESIAEFLLQYYDGRFVPREIYLPFKFDDQTVFEEMLISNSESAMRLKITTPQRGEKKQLLRIAEKNSEYAIQEYARQKQTKSAGLKILQQKLNLPSSPQRIECIDISNIQGTAIVASDVCFMNGKPAKELYRLYNISDIADGPDDFGSIREVVRRRLKRAVVEHDLPDLLVIDGGKGQLSAAMDSAKNFPELAINIVSLAKSRLEKTGKPENPSRSDSSPTTLRSKERIFTASSDRPIELEVGSPEYRIMTQIRDEAHRFAITHHRRRRKKILHTSALEGIPGIGPALRQKIFATFGDIDGIKRASLDQLSSVKGLKDSAALALFSHFRSQEDEIET